MSDGQLNTWGYVRLSQDGREDTIEDQREKLKRYCRRRDELRLVTILSDGKYTSGFNDDRSKYQTIRQKIENGELDAVVVRDRARLARDFDERLRLLVTLRENGVELHVAEEGGPADVHSIQGAIMESMKAGMDHLSKMAEMERAREIVEKRVDAGHWQGGIPYGLTMGPHGKYLVADEKEIGDAIDAIENVEGGMSERAVAREAGIAHNTVGKILDRREAYRAADRGATIGRGFAIIWPDESPADD
ncbi:recombinase family protein [Haloarcula marina]|uniref:recombinase family protein n=1 Tax=Haloarcula marina TaxID=2961574 RepID=UPI0020B84F8E|nr:recombinase family protein [Halomicroarcula marina]